MTRIQHVSVFNSIFFYTKKQHATSRCHRVLGRRSSLFLALANRPPTLRALSASIRQHTSAYVSIRQHTSTSSTCRQHCVPSVAWATCLRCLRELYLSAHVIIRQHTPAYASIRQHTPAYASIRQHTSVSVASCVSSTCQHTPAYASIRQHTPAYASIRQHTPA